jgi:putative ABC transport system permease protein
MKSLPAWSERLLRAICPEDLYEQIVGDLIEIYNYDVKTVGKRKAKLRFAAACFRFFRPGILLRNRISFQQNPLRMLPHFFKLFFRTSLKHRSHFIINITGLVIGMMACALISLYVLHERSYDNFHTNKDHIFRLRQDRYTGNEITRQWTAGPWGIGADLKNNFPEVKRYVSVNRGGNRSVVLSNGDIFFDEGRALYASADFFRMFSYPLVKGIDSLVLRRPFTMVVSESLARRYFGNDNPVGKTLKCNGKESYEITGMFKDVPENTHLKFDALLSYESLLTIIGPVDTEELMSNWGWSGNYTYIELESSADPNVFEAKLPAFVQKKAGEVLRSWGETMAFVLQPVSTIHLDSDFKDELEANGDRSTVDFLGLIAAFILLMAWINYINLTTARSIERAREVGIRKVLGSDRTLVIRQFLFESFSTKLIAFILTSVLVFFLHPLFSDFIERKLELPEVTAWNIWLYIAAVFTVGVVASGLYPAFVLSGFRPINILKGNLSTSSSGNYLRKGLVSLQFVSSVVLIVGILAVFEQIKFMRSSPLGLSIDQRMVIQGPAIKDSTYQSQFNTFREALLNYPEIEKIAVSTDVPGRTVTASNGGVRLVGQDVKMGNSYRVVQANEDFIETFGIEVLAGRSFSREHNDHWRTALVNETAMKLLGFTDAQDIIGQKIYVFNDELEVVGVVKDFHQESLKKKVDQLIFVCDNEISDYYTVKLNATSTLTESIAKVETRYRSTFPGNPFHYFFVDDYFNQQYKSDILFQKVFGLFTFLAVVIACLGLLGLSSYMAIQRTKEIGIRKLLGASVKQILLLVSKEFFLIIFVANVIAWPISYWFVNDWLNRFPYRVNLGILIFIIPTIISLVIAMLTVATQSILAARANPIQNLRQE